MSSKNVALPFKTISSVSVSGTSVVTSSVTSIQYQDTLSIQCVLSGTPTGTLDVQGSLDYKTGYPQGTGQMNAGTWTSITQAAPNALPVTIGSGTSSVLVNMSQLAFPWVRLQFTSSTASGTINAFVSSKSWSA